jgi:hypothetical protein
LFQAIKQAVKVMPILNNVGSLMYVLAALFGGAVILLKLPNLSLTGMGARGTHDELMAMKGSYYQLYTGAFDLA